MPRRRSSFLLIAGLGAIAAFLILATGLVQAWRERRPQTLASEPVGNDLAQQVQELRRELSVMKVRQNLVDVAALDRKAAPEPGQAPASDPRALEEERRARQHAARAAVDAALMKEEPDAAWSLRLGKRLSDTFLGANLTGVTVDEVHCGKTLCRVELKHADNETQSRVGGVAADQGAFDQSAALWFYDEASTPPRTTVYVAAQGREFPILAGPPSP